MGKTERDFKLRQITYKKLVERENELRYILETLTEGRPSFIKNRDWLANKVSTGVYSTWTTVCQMRRDALSDLIELARKERESLEIMYDTGSEAKSVLVDKSSGLYCDLQKEGVLTDIREGRNDMNAAVYLQVQMYEFRHSLQVQGFDVWEGEGFCAITEDDELFMVIETKDGRAVLISDKGEQDLYKAMQVKKGRDWAVSEDDTLAGILAEVVKELYSEQKGRVAELNTPKKNMKNETLDVLCEEFVALVLKPDCPKWRSKLPKGVDELKSKLDGKFTGSRSRVRHNQAVRAELTERLKQHGIVNVNVYNGVVCGKLKDSEVWVKLPKENIEMAVKNGTVDKYTRITVREGELEGCTMLGTLMPASSGELTVTRDGMYIVQVKDHGDGTWSLTDGNCTLDITEWMEAHKDAVEKDTMLMDYLVLALETGVPNMKDKLAKEISNGPDKKSHNTVAW